MKFRSYLLYTILCVSCSKMTTSSDNTHNGYVSYDFYASLSNNTKTTISNDAFVLWSKGDDIYYYSSNQGNINKYTVSNNGNIAHLSINIPEDDTYLIAAYGCKSILENKGKGCVLSGVWSENQTGLFSDSHVAIAKTYELTNEQLNFHNISSFIKFSINRKDVTKVIFRSNNYEPLHPYGVVEIQFDGTHYKMTPFDKTGNTITINGKGIEDYYLASLPVTLNKGFTIECYNEKNQWIGRVQRTKELVIGENSIVDLGLLDIRIDDEIDLSKTETSNCYIAQPGRKYKFRANFMGNSSSPLSGKIQKINVLWESFCTATATRNGDIISNVKYDGECIHFDANEEGNALIVARDIDDEIIWSWHIWVEEDDLLAMSQSYNNGTFMDRNLGATSNKYAEPTAQGLYYQLGRKDPILPASSVTSDIMALSTIAWPVPQKFASSNISDLITFATRNPTIVVSDWNPDTNLWTKEKSEYDPCPQGWKVAENIPYRYVGRLSLSDYNLNTYGLFVTDDIFFPASNILLTSELSFDSGDYHNGQYWTSSPFFKKYDWSNDYCPDPFWFGMWIVDNTRYIAVGTYSYTSNNGSWIGPSSLSPSRPCHIRCQKE